LAIEQVQFLIDRRILEAGRSARAAAGGGIKLVERTPAKGGASL